MKKFRYTNKERAFVEHYLRTWNGTQAARDAGYRGNDNTLGALASQYLRKVKIQSLIEKRMKELTLDADEVLMRLAQHATGSISDFIDENGIIDWNAVKEKGHLVKKITHRKGQQVTLEIHDSQAALVHLGRHYSLFKDRVQIDDWRTEVIQLIKEGKLTFEQLVKDFDLERDLATELFVAAGVKVV